MDNQDLEQAIKSDLTTLSTFKMGAVSAGDLYLPLLKLIFKLSFMMLVINTFVRLVLQVIGLYHPAITMNLMIGTWVGCLIVSCFMGFSLSRLLLISKMLKGRLKTERLIKAKYWHFSLMYFGIYTLVYMIVNAFCDSGIGLEDMDREKMGAVLVIFGAILSQFFAFIVSIVTTGLLVGVELDRLGLSALFNVIGDVVVKAKNQARQTNPTKDA